MLIYQKKPLQLQWLFAWRLSSYSRGSFGGNSLKLESGPLLVWLRLLEPDQAFSNIIGVMDA